MIYKSIICEKKDGYAIVRLNRPEHMNAISLEMTKELEDCFCNLEKDDDVRSILLTGGEIVFSAGMDIKEMAELTEEQLENYFKTVSHYLVKIYTCQKPLVAAVGGIALGGGFNLVTVCDIVVASETAIFGHPELKFGINPLFYPLSQLVGMLKAKEIAMLGEPIGALEALRIGLANKVVAPENLLDEALAIVKELAMRSPKALTAVKKLSNITPKLDKAAAVEMEMGVSTLLFISSENRNYLREFLLKKSQKNEVS